MKRWWTTLSKNDRIVLAVTLVGLGIVLGAVTYDVLDIIPVVSVPKFIPPSEYQIVINRGPDPSIRHLLWKISELIAIPVTLGLIAHLFNQHQQEREHKQREQVDRLAMIRAEENALQNYIDRMAELLLKYNIRTDEQSDEICNLARTRTLAVLRRLTESRKSSVVQFLYEARLIKGQGPLVDLSQADLNNISLYKARLDGINLQETQLNGSNLSHAHLSGSNLAGARLTKFAVLDDEENEIASHPTRLIHTKLMKANLTGTDLRQSKLRRAQLQQANLSQALLDEANFCWANLTGASLTGAKLGGADLSQATLTNADFTDATYNDETRWPEGFDIEASGAKFIKNEDHSPKAVFHTRINHGRT